MQPSHMTSTHFGVAHFLQAVRRLAGRPLERILIVGCGAGNEVLALQQRSGALTVGFDLDRAALHYRTAEAPIVIADVHHMPFPSSFFDAVFSYHVLEHAGDARSAVRQIFRVLKPDGLLYIGVPNKSRLISVGDRSDEARPGKVGKVVDMLESNLADYRFRLAGRFENQCGAHAGFTTQEMTQLLAPYFEAAQDLTGEYLRGKYARWGTLARLATAPVWLRRVAPSIYVICRKRRDRETS